MGYRSSGGPGSDTTAIHDDTSGEINAISEKLVPVIGDNLIIEDSADSNNKKKIQIGNLPASGGSTLITRLADGLAVQKPELYLLESAGTVYLEMEAVGGGDVTYQIDGAEGTLDCTTGAGVGGRAQVALTAGADVNTLEENYVYVTRTGAVLTLAASTSKPTGAFGWVAKVTIQDATTFASEGPMGFQRTTESVNDSRGQISHEREKLRFGDDITGAVPTTTITTNGGSADNVHLEATGGEVYQLHRQTWPAFTTGPYFYGNGLDIYEKLTDLNAALSESDGTSLSGKYFNLIVWGVINKNTSDCKLFVNLPSGSYTGSSDALADVNNTADYSVPSELKSVAFMIARMVLRHQTLSSGTWTEIDTLDIRGTQPGFRVGGTTSIPAGTTFADNAFAVYDDGDPTKQLDFQVSGVTTGTTRTLTIPDKDGTIALLDDTGGVDKSTTFLIEDEFVGKDGGSGRIGQLGWLSAMSGFTVQQLVDTDSDYPGNYTMRGSATVNNFGRWYISQEIFFDDIIKYSLIVNHVDFDNSTNSYSSWMGLMSTATNTWTDIVDGVYFLIKDNDTTLYGVTEASNTRTETNLGTVSADTYYTLEFHYNGTNVQFYVNGVATGSPVTTNLPTSTTTLGPVLAFRNDATNAAQADVTFNYFALKKEGITRNIAL